MLINSGAQPGVPLLPKGKVGLGQYNLRLP